MVSRFPAGEYTCAKTYSPRFKRNMWAVQDVPGRSGVRFHAANYAGWEGKVNPRTGKEFKSELDGCIALGKSEGEMSGQWALLQSKTAIAEFEEFMGDEPFRLVVRDA